MSETEAKRELSIPFESFLNRGIHKEKSESFQESFFKDVYNQATEAIVIIDESNRKKDEDIVNNADFEQKLYDVQNVIAFTGRRGTGKTSAMLTFVDSLVAGTYIGGFTDSLKNTRFYSIPYIDASILEKNEDIFEIVLSKMLLELNGRSNLSYHRDLTRYDALLNETRENIVNVYNQYVSLKKTSDFDSASSYSLMGKMAEKHDIRSKIVDLMKKYVDCMIMCDSNHYAFENAKGYLVICIDDIDMSQKNHMEVMQSIYQYLMIPRIIVMITSNFPILSASIEQKFHSKVFVSSEQAQKSLDLCREQTYDFLRKIIPFDMRIAMPSWRKQDYRSLTSIRVALGNNKNLEELNGTFYRLKKSCLFDKNYDDNEIKKISPKALIMTIIAHRTKTFLDVAGEKFHFMEPDSLRNLNDLFYLLYNMNNIDLHEDENDEYYCELEANRKVLLNYLYFKMIPECNLSIEEEQVIKEFSRDRLHRKGRRIWDYYYKLFTRATEKVRIERLYGTEFYENEVQKNKVENYSFGELFRILYFGSRLNLMSKKFIQIILASLSFVMPQFIETEKDKEKDENGRVSNDDLHRSGDQYKYKSIRDVFRYTLLGTWCNDLFDDKTVDIVVKKDSIKDAASLKNFMYLLMLTPMSTGETIPTKVNATEIIISAKLDPTALFMNLVRIKRFFDLRFVVDDSNPYLLKDLISTVISANVPNKGFLDDILGRQEMDSKPDLLEKLFDTSYDDNKTVLKISWFLLKNIDLTYNVIKRVVIYLIYLSDNNLRDKKVPKSTPEEAIKEFYDNLKKKLNEEFEVYNSMRQVNWEFEKNLTTNPVVNLFLDDAKPLEKMKEQGISIAWSDSPEQSKPVLNGDMTLNDVLDFCAASYPEIVSTLKRIYSLSLDRKISMQNAIKIVSLIFDNQVGNAITEILNILNKKRGQRRDGT